MIVEKIINSFYSSNSYIILDGDDCVLIDCGDLILIKDYLKSAYNIKYVLITHSHIDHIYGLNKLYEYNSEFTIITSVKGKEGLYSDILNLSKYIYKAFVYKYDNSRVVNNGDLIEFGNKDCEVYYTPGHDWSSLSFRIDNLLFKNQSPAVSAKMKIIRHIIH